MMTGGTPMDTPTFQPGPVTRKATTLARPMTTRQPAICKIHRLATLPTTGPLGQIQKWTYFSRIEMWDFNNWSLSGYMRIEMKFQKLEIEWIYVDIPSGNPKLTKIIQNPHSHQGNYSEEF